MMSNKKNNLIFTVGFLICISNFGCSSGNEVTEIKNNDNLLGSECAYILDANTSETEYWNGNVVGCSDNLWLYLNQGKNAFYDFRIGTTGVISEIRDRTEGSKALLSPSFNKEQTDRVVQWTIWSLDLIRNLNYNGRDFEQRYNVTQGGTGTNQFHQTNAVTVDKIQRQVDVYGKADLQWKLENQNVIKGTHTALTRYSIDRRGFLKIYRVVLIDEPKLNGVAQEWKDLYFESWTPMNGNSNVFSALALNVDSNGVPTETYDHKVNIPIYPFLKATSSTGYAVVYNKINRINKDAIGIVYGQKNVESSNSNDAYVLNTLGWDNGIGVLPAIETKGILLPNSIIVQTLYMVPRQGLDANMRNLLVTLSSEIPAPKIYRPNEIPSGSEVESIYNTLISNKTVTGTATDNLQPLVKIN